MFDSSGPRNIVDAAHASTVFPSCAGCGQSGVHRGLMVAVADVLVETPVIAWLHNLSECALAADLPLVAQTIDLVSIRSAQANAYTTNGELLPLWRQREIYNGIAPTPADFEPHYPFPEPDEREPNA
ncbi:MAG: hypothetical protein ACYDA1_10350 [Vulcanimicrobiaceae bacterium]